MCILSGGVSVATHLLNTSNTIIKAAIIESNPFGLPLRTTETWGELPTMFKSYAGCDILRSSEEQLKCLRNIGMEDLLSAQLKAQSDLAVEYKWFIDLFMPWYVSFVFIYNFVYIIIWFIVYK